jgi:hypothetical protein
MDNELKNLRAALSQSKAASQQGATAFNEERERYTTIVSGRYTTIVSGRYTTIVSEGTPPLFLSILLFIYTSSQPIFVSISFFLNLYLPIDQSQQVPRSSKRAN